VQFAIAIAGRAPLLLIDEPTTGLDVGARRALWLTVRTLRAEGAAVLLTTHYLEEADALADRIVLLDRGRIQRQGTPAEIKATAAGSRVVLRSSLEPDVVAALAGSAVELLDDGRVALLCREPEALLRRLLPRDPQLAGLEVRPLSLEDAVLLHSATATVDTAAPEAA
jgi:ABC-2 type transport system ATP-binding protein